MLKKGSTFRFEGHYHPYGEEQHDRMRVGIKFYPKGYKPDHIVTSHRIRTGVGNDWVLNRERVEDLLLRAGVKLSIDEPSMPTGALVAENPLHSAALLSIPPKTVVTHDRYSFYNPAHHPFFDQKGGRIIYFEGTYTAEFSGNDSPTPRYDYNQVMYRLDLGDPRLKDL